MKKIFNYKEITIPSRIPSKKNSKRIIQVHGRPIIISSKDYLDWEKDALVYLKGIKINGKIEGIVIKIFADSKRKSDLTNKAESIMDALVKAEVIEDDNWFVVPELLLKFGGVDKENPRAEIVIKSIDNS